MPRDRQAGITLDMLKGRAMLAYAQLQADKSWHHDFIIIKVSPQGGRFKGKHPKLCGLS